MALAGRVQITDMSMQTPTEILRDLIRTVAWRHGVVTRVYEEFGPAVSVVEHSRRQFRDTVEVVIQELRTELGPTVDPAVAEKVGINPELLLGDPPFEEAPSVIVAFAVWRSKDLWVFVAGRYASQQEKSHYVLLLGATSQSADVAIQKTA